MPSLEALLDSLGFKHWMTVTTSFVLPFVSLIGCIFCSPSLFNKWFSQENYSKDYSLRKEMVLIDKRLISIRPPKFIPITPRSIQSWKTWRAHEYLSFLIYYSIPIFNDIMESDQLEHLIK